MDTIILPDGYNGDFVECEREPIEKDGETYKLRVKGSHLVRWCSRKQWEYAVENRELKLQVIDLVELLKKSIKKRNEVSNA